MHRGFGVAPEPNIDEGAFLPLREELARYPNTGRFLAGRLRHDLAEAEKALVEDCIAVVETRADGEVLIRRGQVCNQSTMLIDGFMLRTIEVDGNSHAVSFHVPGDFVDLHAFALKRLDHNIVCVGPTRVGLVPHERITDIMRRDPHLARLFWFSTLLDAAIHRQWITVLERLTVPRRLAHLFAEIWRRLDMVGLGFPDGFATPLTQADLASMCGATVVHTNRAVGELRRGGLADFRRGEVRIASRDALEAYAEFSPDYLYGPGSLTLRD